MKPLFNFVRDILQFLSSLSGLSYAAVNIVVYYYLIPLIYIIMIDKIIGGHYLKLIYLIIFIVSLFIIENFENFSASIFIKSQNFLKVFSIIGWDYFISSVVICFIIPFGILLTLIYFIIK